MNRGRLTTHPALAFGAASAIAILLVAGVARGQGSAQPERFTAWAVSMSAGMGANTTIDIRIDRWTPAADRERFLAALIDKGPEALQALLQNTPSVGRIRTTKTVGDDLRYAWQVPMEGGGRRIIIATDRPIGLWETRSQPRTLDYPFSFIEIHFDSKGVGEGKMAVSTKITVNKKTNTLELENWSSEPVRLQNVKAEPLEK
jgi:hypothetical protein